MTLKPLIATKEIQQKYIDFYKSNFALGKEKLSEKLDGLKENNHLWKSPYILISQNYEPGKKSNQLMLELDIEENLADMLRDEEKGIKQFFKHQENALTNIIKEDKNTIVSSGTGSGKTESFLIPILNHCSKHGVEGIKAIVVYPMNALANDQVDRLRDILFTLNAKRDEVGKREITFGIYTGPTARTIFQKSGELHKDLIYLSYKCPSCNRNDALKCDQENGKVILTCKHEKNVKIKFQIFTREELQNNPPDILITNYSMLQRIMVNQKDQPLFENNKIKFLVLDEIHAYGGAKGVDVALLLRRFKRRLLKKSFENNILWKILVLFSPQPELSIILTLPIDESLRRSKLKKEPFSENYNQRQKRIELYHDLINKGRWLNVIDGSDSIEKVWSNIRNKLE